MTNYKFDSYKVKYELYNKGWGTNKPLKPNPYYGDTWKIPDITDIPDIPDIPDITPMKPLQWPDFYPNTMPKQKEESAQLQKQIDTLLAKIAKQEKEKEEQKAKQKELDAAKTSKPKKKRKPRKKKQVIQRHDDTIYEREV